MSSDRCNHTALYLGVLPRTRGSGPSVGLVFPGEADYWDWGVFMGWATEFLVVHQELLSPKYPPYSLTREELRWLCFGQKTGIGEEKVGRLLCSNLLDLSVYLLKFTWFVWWRVWLRIEPKKLPGGRNGSGVHRFKISSFQNLQKTEKHPPGFSHQSFKSSM